MACAYQEAINIKRDKKGVDMILGDTYKTLLNVLNMKDDTIFTTPLYKALVESPKYHQMLDM